MKKIFYYFGLIFLFACFSGCQNTETPIEPDDFDDYAVIHVVEQIDEETHDNNGHNNLTTATGEITISFEFERQEGWASNQFAIWAEDLHGNHIRTIYATNWTAAGGFETREMSIPSWVQNSNVSETNLDAFTGATPSTGVVTHFWDLTDNSGNLIPAAEYRIIIEASTRWANRVKFIETINLNDDFAVFWPEPIFIHESSEEFPALDATATENYMIKNVTITLS